MHGMAAAQGVHAVTRAPRTCSPVMPSNLAAASAAIWSSSSGAVRGAQSAQCSGGAPAGAGILREGHNSTGALLKAMSVLDAAAGGAQCKLADQAA